MLRSMSMFILVFIAGIANAGTKDLSEKSESSSTEEVSKQEELQISVFRNSEDYRYIVSFKNETSNPVTLSLMDYKGNAIYNEKVDGKGIYNKRLDLINLEDGEYKVQVGNDVNLFEKELVIK